MAFLSRPIRATRRSWSSAGGQRGVELVGGQHAVVLGDAGVVDAPEAAAERGRVGEADGDRLAVAQVVGGLDLEGVGEGVAVVQDGPTAAVARVLALVAGHHVGLDPHGRGDALVEVEGQQVGVGQEVVLGQLALARAQLAGRQAWRGRRCRRAPRPAARTRRPGSCPRAGSRPVLPPMAASTMPEQRGGHVHDRHAAVVGGGREPGHVGDEPAADGDDDVGTGEAPGRPLAAELLDRGQRLGLPRRRRSRRCGAHSPGRPRSPMPAWVTIAARVADRGQDAGQLVARRPGPPARGRCGRAAPPRR